MKGGSGGYVVKGGRRMAIYLGTLILMWVRWGVGMDGCMYLYMYMSYRYWKVRLLG